jgi:hypothetical protein
VKRTYKIEFYKNVPIVETEGAKWMFDTGCPISSPNFTLNPKIGEFLGQPGLRMMGTDRLGDYVLIDYSAKVIVSSDDPIHFEGASVPLCHGFMHSCPLVEMTVGGLVKSCYIDTGAAYSYLRGLDKDRFESAGIAEECDLSGSRWTTPMFRVPCELAGCQFEIVCGAASDNKYGVPPDGVIGYDFFKSFTVLINRREYRLSFKPVVQHQ